MFRASRLSRYAFLPTFVSFGVSYCTDPVKQPATISEKKRPIISAQHAANSLCEDRSALYYDTAKKVAAVFDGHGGWQVSEYAANNIVSKLIQNIKSTNNDQKKALEVTFDQIEREVVDGFLPAFQLGIGDVNHIGACALVAVCEGNQLFVANAGDCRAVIGRTTTKIDHPYSWYLKQTAFSSGSSFYNAEQYARRQWSDWFGWIFKRPNSTSASPPLPVHPNPVTPSSQTQSGLSQLNTSSNPKAIELCAVQVTNDHNARELSEKYRLANEHPNEADIVVCKDSRACYVKSRLQPTRSLGDVYLKYPIFNGPKYDELHGKTRGSHVSSLTTPPYITHKPEVHNLTLTNQDVFLVLATDGVWDFLTNEMVVSIVEGCIYEGKREEAANRIVSETLRQAALTNGLHPEAIYKLPANRRRDVYDDTTVMIMYFQDNN